MNTPDQPPKPDDEAPLEPAAMLQLVRQQQDEVARRLARQIPWILLAWGIAWTVGFGMLWLIDGAKPSFSVPWPIAATVFAALTVAAIVVSAVVGSLAGRGIRSGPGSAFTGTVFGVTGAVGFLAISVFAYGLIHNGMPDDLQNIYFPVASTLFVGFMYLMAAAIWRQVSVLVLGAWIILIALAAPFFGYPGHYLVFAIAGGGAFLLSAATLAFRTRATRISVHR
jgi:hypothetical protein